MGTIMAPLGLKFHNSPKMFVFFIGMAITALISFFTVTGPRLLTELDWKLLDMQMARHRPEKTTGIPVVVDIDEKSLAEHGQWPWPRYRIAMLLAKMANAGVAAVGLDILFAEPDRTSPALLQKAMERDLGVSLDLKSLPQGLDDNDRILAGILAQGPFVLGYNFLFEEGPRSENCAIRPVKLSLLSEPGAKKPEDALVTPRGVTCPLPELAAAATAAGFFNTSPDSDGILRRVPFLLSYRGNVYPSLSLATLLTALRRSDLLVKMDPDGIKSVRLPGVEVPLDQHGRFLVNFRGPRHTFPYISASDIRSDRVDPTALKGKIAFIGTSAAGLMDLRTIALDPVYPGVESHANIVDAILSKDFVHIPAYAPGIELLATILTGLLSTLLLVRATALLSLPVLGALAAGLWFGSASIYSAWRIFLSPVSPVIVLAANFAVLSLVKFWQEERQKKFIHSAFSHYLAPSVIEQIMKDPGRLTLDGEEKEVTILFSDVRGFTTLSEQLSPTQVTDLLHEYLTPMTRLVTEHDGTLDKFIGDAVMAFWNAPLDVPDHPYKAVTAALSMLDTLKELNVSFNDKFGFGIKIGVGLHCGKVRVGNMGSADLFAYTLIGDNVNLTSRLEGLTKYYGQEILVTDAIRMACGERLFFLEMDRVRVKGKNEPVTIFTVHRHETAASRSEEFEAYARAYSFYQDARFKEAGALFDGLKAAHPESLLYAMYAERCEHLASEPPGGEWDGVYTHKSK